MIEYVKHFKTSLKEAKYSSTDMDRVRKSVSSLFQTVLKSIDPKSPLRKGDLQWFQKGLVEDIAFTIEDAIKEAIDNWAETFPELKKPKYEEILFQNLAKTFSRMK